ncbi:MAG: glycoside hydrolase family 97 catalytic domain-containing protein [Actinomycetota bacterium]
MLPAITAPTSDAVPEPDDVSAAETIVIELSLDAPGGELRVEIGLDSHGCPTYRVLRTVAGTAEPVVAHSPLGLDLSTTSLASGLRVADVSPVSTFTDQFELPTGKARQSTLSARSQSITFAADGQITLTVEAIAADTGVAIRYGVGSTAEPSNGAAGELTVEREHTRVAVDPLSVAWVQAHDGSSEFAPAYEQMRTPATRIQDLPDAPWGHTLPALFNTPNTGWLLVTEAAVGPGMYASHLSTVADDRGPAPGPSLGFEPPHPGDGGGVGATTAQITLPWRSPWRVFVTSPDLAGIVESNLVRHLAPAGPTPESTPQWIAAGRSSWSWWSDHDSSRNPSCLSDHIDLAADLGWEYSLVDANWTEIADDDLAALFAQAQRRGVGLWLWYNSGGPNNAIAEEPRDRMHIPAERQAELARIAALGVVGVKVDFFQSDKATSIDLIRGILADALAVGLMVNLHGTTVPRGWCREFPNLMTTEAVRGAEYYRLPAGGPTYGADAPRHNSELPFTRNVVGSMDFTPVVLGDLAPRVTTNGHELALTVVFESGVLCFADEPAVYRAQPPAVIELLRTVPAAWDETRLIDGYPGRHVVLARRRGAEWWIGAIDGSGDGVTCTIDVQALLHGDAAELLLVGDEPGSDADSYHIVDGPAPGRLGVELTPNGGFLARLRP